MGDAHPDGLQSPTEEIQVLYSELALHPRKDFGWGKGKENARNLGYDARWLDHFPDVVWESAAAVGNPFSLGSIVLDETVVDLGCGAGADLCIVASLIGDRGRAIGIDITPAMVDMAKESARLLGLRNAEVHVADIAAVPLGDACADFVISSGAITCRRTSLASSKRYSASLDRPAGSSSPTWCGIALPRPRAAPPGPTACPGRSNPSIISTCSARRAFRDAELVARTSYRTAPTTIGATFRARKPEDRQAK